MNESITLNYDVDSNDFTRAGEASSSVKRKLKLMGVDPDIIRKVAISLYEGEINMVIHSYGGTIEVIISTDMIEMILRDKGPGIEDTELAMQAGYTTAPDNIRSLGFGAGMGLPNMKKYSDDLKIESVVGKGTTVRMKVYIPKNIS
ncbi:MAG: anti-sigma regulatory factor [Clostridiales bacterium]|jgi:anti-sigma regulatory factor (Ser/Thr protein kinase)|nr:anti-sigma regulatory factor [Clostridiales bacterium]